MRPVLFRFIALALSCLFGVFAEAATFTTRDAGLKLGVPTWTNAQVQFTLNCESSVTYVIERSPDLQTWTPVLTNSEPSIARVILADAPGGVEFYRARRGPLPAFAAALAASGAINLYGN